MPKDFSVGIVLYYEEKFLLLKYRAGHWGFAKGKPHTGEKKLDAARREVKEETGLEGVYIVRDFLSKEEYFFKRRGQTVFKEVHYYLGESPSNEIQLSEEHIGYEWLSYEEAMTKLSFPETRDILKQAYDYLKEHGLFRPS